MASGKATSVSTSSSGGISAELWQRLRQLDRIGRCEIVLCRTNAKDGSCDPKGLRVWVVTIRKHIPPSAHRYDMVQHARPTLAEALPLAVEEAEKRGWAR